MKHIPHLFLPGPWAGNALQASSSQVDHLQRVLRLEDGADVTYTNGEGSFGVGMWSAGVINRRSEEDRPRPSELVMAVAPPNNRDRVRFVVEKLAEVGVSSLLWLITSHGSRRLPSIAKQRGWAISALEQSRGSWLMQVSDGFVRWDDLERPLAVCEAGGSGTGTRYRTVAVGPEGGFSSDEIPPDSTLVSLGETVLRVETAAVIAASIFR